MTTTVTYQDRPRTITEYTVKRLTNSGTRTTITTAEGTGFSRSNDEVAGLTVGTVFELETVNFSLITGIRLHGTWVFRKSDQDLDDDHREMVEGFARERAARLDQNRDKWAAKEAQLPQWIRGRLEHFHQTGGETFALEGWGYELVIAELAVAYAASNLEETDAISALGSSHGSSGNQHDMARALAKAHLAGEDVSGTVSALSPITGDVDYSGGSESNQPAGA